MCIRDRCLVIVLFSTRLSDMDTARRNVKDQQNRNSHGWCVQRLGTKLTRSCVSDSGCDTSLVTRFPRASQLWSDEFTISIMALEGLPEQLRSFKSSPLDTRRWSFEKLLRRGDMSTCNKLGCVACCRARISPPWACTGQKRWRARGEAQIRERSVFA